MRWKSSKISASLLGKGTFFNSLSATPLIFMDKPFLITMPFDINPIKFAVNIQRSKIFITNIM